MDNESLRDRLKRGIGDFAIKQKKKITRRYRSAQTTADCSQVDTASQLDIASQLDNEEQRRYLSSGTILNTENDRTITKNNTGEKILEEARLLDREDADSVATALENLQLGSNPQLDAGEAILAEDLQRRNSSDGTSRELHDATLTPIWTNALVEWRREHPDAYEALKQAGIGAMKSPDQMQGVLQRITGREESTNRIRARCKEYQPTITGLRGIAMGFSNVDPYKVAPLICVAVFFTIDVSTTFPDSHCLSVSLSVSLRDY
jgi:hypothetical protein